MSLAAGTAAGLGLALFSALTSAFAHALVKSGEDKLAVQSWIRLIEGTIALPFVLWVGLPPASLWPWLIAAALIHGVYQLVLAWSYSVNDFTAAYPIARGVAPICTALLGMLLLGDRLDGLTLIGIGIVSAGILCLASHHAVSARGFVAAAITGLLTTCYTLVDAKGVRAGPEPLTFIAWFFLIGGVPLLTTFFSIHGRRAFARLAIDRGTGIRAGIISPIAFAPALFALGLAPVGAVAAVRESSVLFGLALGSMLLGERIGGLRLGGAVLVTAGTLTVIARSAFA
jgi:drug/metabolite transporter (DMT)-like permease